MAAVSTAGLAHGQINSDWNTGNGAWNVPGNWNPVDVPDNGGFTYNVQIGNLPAAANAAVTFIPEDGTSDTISQLTISNGADLLTNGFQLNVDGPALVSGAGSTIRVDPHATPGTAAFQAADLDLAAGGGLILNGGIASVATDMDITATGALNGYGTLNVGDFDLAIEQAFQNSGIIQVFGTTLIPGTLTIHANGSDRIDLDGDNEIGIVDVSNVSALILADTLTLIIDGPLADNFGAAVGGQLQIGQRDTIQFNQNFGIDAGAVVDMNGGTLTATLTGPGAITSISGATFNITNSAVINNDMTFTGAANTVTVNANSTLTLNGTVAIPQATALAFAASTSHLVVGGNVSITDAANDLNWDGPGSASTTITGSGLLNLAVDQVDTGNDSYGGTLNLNDDGDLTVNVTATSWTLLSAMNKNNAGTSVVSGDAIIVSGDITVNAGVLDLPQVTLQSTADVTTSGTLLLGAASTLAGPATLGGTGLLRMEGTSTISANTTVNVSTFDWDGLGTGTTHTILDGVVFTINSTAMDPDGSHDDGINLGGNGAQLIINNVGSWTMNRTLNANTAAAGLATIGGSSRMTLNGALGILNVDGNTNAAAPITFGASSTTSIDGGVTLRLQGGNTASNANFMAGGVINGPGLLAADTARALRGFGTINSNIDFDGTAALLAQDGVLTVAGTILDIGTVGTGNANGTLNVVNAWNNNVATAVNLSGGTFLGGTITNDLAVGIAGSGFVGARVINNSRLISNSGGTLVFQTAGNDNDWDGAGNTGSLSATSGGVLEVRDVGAAFGFAGSVVVGANSRVFTNGFGLDFNPGSSINLTAGTFESTHSTDIGGTLLVNVGGESTLKVTDNVFLSFESTSNTTLNDNLRVRNNNVIVEAGAVFSGGGALINSTESHMVLENLANVGVLLENHGAIRPGNSQGIGRVDLFDYQQSNDGELFVELKGTALNAFDRLVASGDVVVDGYLSLDIDDVSPGVPFVPALGNTFNIITGNSVTGQFDYKDVSGMPNGLTFAVVYLGNAVQLQVVNTPFFSADFDDDGDVDLTDLAIWDGAFDLNQLGDANGDNITDIDDWTIWRDQFGSAPLPTSAIPEPTGLGLIAAVLSAGLLPRRIRRQSKTAILPAILFLLSLVTWASPAVAVPQMEVVNNGLSGGNRQWLVRVAADPSLFNFTGEGALAVGLAFEVDFGQLVSATKNGAAWPYDLPNNNNPFDGAAPNGMYVNLATDRVFASLGSDPFDNGNFSTVFTLVTQGSGPVSLHWGGQTVIASGDSVTGSIIAQAGTIYSGYQGSVAFGAIPGDANFDGQVDAVDLGLLATSWQDNGGWTNGDFDGTGVVNLRDLMILANNWQVGVPSQPFDEAALALGLPISAVPEPGVMGLLWAAVAIALRRRRRHRMSRLAD